ncbi:cyclic dehypoxanthinyl futalosine synthase [Chloracidobacterium aggregatum]|uniref:Cyclic dehypoxanthine futalosine synthase n=1 Tax=Chloracidobacterium sp. N TaxID=2821540 RepID=A0ABX8B697_9BACT|nr:cyclic dehypoxanthinyl futalosine synthase [Chloracidobacterium aggregatum]QUV86151.1 dehypoxanthine futalosine cyclase [Chloracidobacterium sp. 2]QUV89403.1 dehypoxanthine futalosine cyclase [Chloracidobacterium sp. S]QUV92594.1 dehypoxanthine futalosine cyclase [Chloracidobacterium sp. A]QUV95069.1 dehypoxanthine futalosine cyclase [Chloracidobacterium sp. N]QUV98276.1 dehypoxanthine futalosine cyclase [Chloracidobacterium sp. E]
MTDVSAQLERLYCGERPPAEVWLEVIYRAPLDELLYWADRLRADWHPDNVVTYVIDRNINYSNICTSVCTFCAFYRKPGDPEGYVHDYETLFRKVEETLALGGSGILMQGGLHPDLKLEWYEELLRQFKARYPIHLHCFSPPEILNFARVNRLSVREVLQRLRAAGLDSIPGGGGEILVDEIRMRRRTECNSQEWLAIMETAHELGIPTTATMMYGMGETDAHRLEHLRKIHELQARTGGFIAFIPWTLQPDSVPIGKVFPDRIAPDIYLRWFAAARLYLRNIPNLQVSWLTQGFDVARRALRGGANDMGSIMIEENVVSAAGAKYRADEARLVQVIREAGFVPCKRNAAYRRLETPAAAEAVA